MALELNLAAPPLTDQAGPLLREVQEKCPNPFVARWIEECIALSKPEKLFFCDGSKREREELFGQGCNDGTFTKLNQQKWPGCYYHRSNTNDVARSEHLTFICTPSQDMAGATNYWMEPKQAYAKLRGLFDGCMAGRTMYIVPFVMGPIGSPLAKVGVQVTDSLYVAVSMGLMTRMGDVAWKQLGDGNDVAGGGGDDFTRCLHALGDVNPDRRFVCHFSFDNTVWH